MSMHIEKKPAYLCKSQVKKLGFSEKMVKELLPEPEERPNPHYRKAAPMKVWPTEVIQTVMRTSEYEEAHQAYAVRSAAARKPYERKCEETQELLQELVEGIRVKVIPLDELEKRAVRHRQRWHDANRPYEDFNAEEAGDRTRNRWMVNYLRHKLTPYEAQLRRVQGRSGNEGAYYRIFAAVLDAIADAYPTLREECERQKSKKDREWSMCEDYFNERAEWEQSLLDTVREGV